MSDIIEIKKHGTTIFDTSNNLIVKSTTDDLCIMPWRLLHDGYQVTRQETVVSVDADAGIPITHSKFTEGGRIISAKIFVDSEPLFWVWYKQATNNRALPCWIYDARIDGFMRCYILEEPSLSPASTSVNGCFVNLKIYAKSTAIAFQKFVTEGMPDKYVVEGANNLVYTNDGEVAY